MVIPKIATLILLEKQGKHLKFLDKNLLLSLLHKLKPGSFFFSGKSSLCTLENRMHSPFPVFIYLGTILIVPVNPDSRRALKPKERFPIPNQRSIVSLNLFLIHCFGNLPSFPLIFPLIAHESRKKRLLLSLFPFSKTQNEHSPSWLLSMITGCHLLSKHFQE